MASSSVSSAHTDQPQPEPIARTPGSQRQERSGVPARAAHIARSSRPRTARSDSVTMAIELPSNFQPDCPHRLPQMAVPEVCKSVAIYVSWPVVLTAKKSARYAPCTVSPHSKGACHHGSTPQEGESWPRAGAWAPDATTDRRSGSPDAATRYTGLDSRARPIEWPGTVPS